MSKYELVEKKPGAYTFTKEGNEMYCPQQEDTCCGSWCPFFLIDSQKRGLAILCGAGGSIEFTLEKNIIVPH